MSDDEIETLLGEMLLASPGFVSAGYGVLVDDGGHVIVTRWGHARGVWRCIGGELQWIPAGYNAPTIKVADVKTAVAATVGMLRIV